MNRPRSPDYDPSLYDASHGTPVPLPEAARCCVRFGEGGRLTLATEPSANDLFELTRSGDQWSIDTRSAPSTVQVDQVTNVGIARLKHRTIIKASDRLIIFLLRDDPIVATQYTAGMWLLRQLELPDDSTADAHLDDVTKTVDLAATRNIRPQDLLEDLSPTLLPGALQVTAEPLTIGRNHRRVDLCLPDVRVSSLHATIQQDGERAIVTDLGSTNGTYVNGVPIRGATRADPGSRIQIGPYTLVYRDAALYPLTHDNNVELAAKNLTRRVPDRAQRGKTKVILDDISLVVRPKEFVCILGPSGSGKSTLLSALSARVPADEGQVLLNGENLYSQFELLKQNLAVVPQKDVLHDVLPLSVALRYSARLRLPADTTSADIEARVDTTLDAVNLVQRQFTPIRKLSGGQIKRASWANEAICNPSLIFLDEVTSGLDEQTDAEMMRLFRRVADEGKTIVCVTHSLSYVEQNCNLLVILATGGALAFVGTPAEAMTYFRVVRLGDVYQRLSERSSRHWKQRFLEDELYQRHVARRLPEEAGIREKVRRRPRPSMRELRLGWRQFVLLLRRNAAILWADKRALGMMLGQSLFIGLMLVWLFGDLSQLDAQDEANRLVELTAPGLAWDDLFPETQQEYLAEAEAAKRMDRSSKLLFLVCISCIWFGCNNAAKEIVKERAIYSKERDVGLKVPSYYAAKLTLLGMLSAAQAALLLGLVVTFARLGGSHSAQWAMLSLASLTGVAMGLTISAWATSGDVAATIVPMALIPQIILAGLIAPLLHHTREFSQVMIPAYWSYQGLLGTLDMGLQERLRDTGYLVLGMNWTAIDICGILVLYVLVFAVTALAALYTRDTA